MKKIYSYQPFFEATLKLIKESYARVTDIPDEVMKELQDQVKSFDYNFVFYEAATDSFDLANSEGFDQTQEANTLLASMVEDSGFTVSLFDFDESPSWKRLTAEGSPYNWIFPGEYFFELYKRKEFQEAYSRNEDEEEEEDPAGQDLYPHLARVVTTPFAAVIKIDDTQYIKGYEDSESAYEAMEYMFQGDTNLSIYFKDGSSVVLYGEGTHDANDFTLADNYENAPVKGEGQQYLLSDPEHQITEKSGSSSTFIELFEDLEDSYEKDAFALDVVGIR